MFCFYFPPFFSTWSLCGAVCFLSVCFYLSIFLVLLIINKAPKSIPASNRSFPLTTFFKCYVRKSSGEINTLMMAEFREAASESYSLPLFAFEHGPLFTLWHTAQTAQVQLLTLTMTASCYVSPVPSTQYRQQWLTGAHWALLVVLVPPATCLNAEKNNIQLIEITWFIHTSYYRANPCVSSTTPHPSHDLMFAGDWINCPACN